MNLGFRSVIFSGTLMLLLVSLLMAAYSLSLKPRRPEVTTWALAYGFLIAGAVFAIFRGVIPDGLSIMAGNVLVTGANIVLLIGVCQFRGRKVRRGLVYGALVAIPLWYAVFTFAFPLFGARFYFYNGTIIAVCAWTVHALLRDPEPELAAVSKMAVTLLAATAVLSLVRMLMPLWKGLPSSITDAPLWDLALQTAQSALASVFGFTLILLRAESLSAQAAAKERQIEESLREKETLLKEIHHRVKNNLQVIVSLINLRVGTSDNEEARGLLLDIERKVMAMAIVHEQLYERPSLSSIGMQSYLSTLVASYHDAYDYGKTTISYAVDAGAVTLPIELAMPLGLILGELITNSQKHAFKGREGGEIRVSLAEADGKLRLTVSDNGNGLPRGYEETREHGLGHVLIQSLALQLRGQLSIRSGDGLEVVVDGIPYPD